MSDIKGFSETAQNENKFYYWEASNWRFFFRKRQFFAITDFGLLQDGFFRQPGGAFVVFFKILLFFCISQGLLSYRIKSRIPKNLVLLKGF